MKAVCVAVLLVVFAVAASFAEQTNTLPTTITVDGVTYSNVTWHTVTPATVTIFHETGVASIPLEKLPPELQQRFDYDPQRAAAYRAQESAAAQQHLIEIQARERLRQQREAAALEAAQKEQEVQEELAREQQAVIQKANVNNNNVEVISVFQVDGAINALPSGGYVAQLALTNQTIVCAHFDEDGRRFLEDVSRKYAEWNARQDPLEQQLQVQAQPGTIVLYGGKGSIRVPGRGYGMAYATGDSQPAPETAPPVSAIYVVREENSSCYSLKGTQEISPAGGLKQYSWP